MIDIIISLIIILFSLPLCIIIAVAIKLFDGNRIFFSSRRIGLGGRQFNMLKFRTMNNDNQSLSYTQALEFQNNFKINDDTRVTKIGYWLRRHSLDEIPQFINVLKGDMSIIGPRPKLPEEIDLYENNKSELLSVLPGISGYWQVHRKTANSDENMRNMDLYYIRNRNLSMDLKLIFMTFLTLLSKNNY